MAHQRGHSVSDAKEPHSVSLKVLRLSRPSLSLQHPLPAASSTTSSTAPAPESSYAYPRKQIKDDAFILAPLLTLPQAFGSAYVGEVFACTLCANNELSPSSNPTVGAAAGTKTISNVRIEAEMKVPSSMVPVPLVLGPDAHSSLSDTSADEKKESPKSPGVTLKEAETLQRIVSFKLSEEGSHVLAVTVTYSETTSTSGRVRTFRKLYQFVAKNAVVVRTKAGLLPSKAAGKKWALEAQLQNEGEDSITLDSVGFDANEGVKSVGLNWEGGTGGNPVLAPGDVQQVCFLIATGLAGDEREGEAEKVPFGRLEVSWRGQMGNMGSLITGELSGKV